MNYPLYSGLTNQGPGGFLIAGGWTRDAGPPATVRLTTSTDRVGIGTATPASNRKLTVRTTGSNQGVRCVTNASTDAVLDTLVFGETGARLVILGTGAHAWGPGGAAVQDVRLSRSATSTLLVDDGAGGSAALNVVGTELITKKDAVNNGATTLLTLTHAGLGAAGAGIGAGLDFSAVDSADAAQVAAQIVGQLTTVTAGAVTGALDFYTRVGGAALALHMQLTGTGALVTQGRQVATSFNLAAAGPYTVDSGATLDDFVGMDTTTGAQATLLPPATDGRRLVCKNTALAAVVNPNNVTPNGAETIDGVAAAVGLIGTQFVTLTGRTGVGWYTS